MRGSPERETDQKWMTVVAPRLARLAARQPRCHEPEVKYWTLTTECMQKRFLSEILMVISDKTAQKIKMQSIDSKMIRRIRATRSAQAFSPVHFLDLGSRAAVDTALSRLTKAGKLRRVARGLYDLPRSHPWFGKLTPKAEDAAVAVAKREGIKLRPTGAAAANLLGLSEQVPGKIIYETDGRSRKLRIAGQEVELRHRSARQMSMSERPTGMIVAAFRALGKEHISTDQLAKIRRKLSAADRRVLLKELPLAPAWMHPMLRSLASSSAAAASTTTRKTKS